jgi:hypothetical protein
MLNFELVNFQFYTIRKILPFILKTFEIKKFNIRNFLKQSKQFPIYTRNNLTQVFFVFGKFIGIGINN